MSESLLKRVAADQIRVRREIADDLEASKAAFEIIEDIRKRGAEALVEYGRRFGDIESNEKWIYDRGDFEQAYESLCAEKRALLKNTAARIDAFAKAQRKCLVDLSADVEGGKAGHFVRPVERAACYAPGGRYPLPSSVLMTVIPARAAGVKTVWVASPGPKVEILAACAVAGADFLLGIGGAQAIAALAFGAGDVPACDVIVGPGNAFVTAAKRLVSGQVRIDMPAGPSEYVVVADGSADPACVAADMLAQAEHDPDAMVALVALDEKTALGVQRELAAQLADLPTADIARRALQNSFFTVAPDVETAISICDLIAPEHLSVMAPNAGKIASKLKNYGALFIGSKTAQALGDYGAGPNHVLPTGGAARSFGGLSVFNFLKISTWIHIEDLGKAQTLYAEAADLAEMEGLKAHRNSLLIRIKK